MDVQNEPAVTPRPTEAELPGISKKGFDDLLIGDTVAFRAANGMSPLTLVKIRSITLTRQFTLESGMRFTRYGNEIGGDQWHHCMIEPLGRPFYPVFSPLKTDVNSETYYDVVIREQAQYRSKQQRRVILRQIHKLTDGSLENLTVDQLERILAIIKGEVNLPLFGQKDGE